ncbi:DUF4349 domain-containing protein [Weeksellaceae bacterium KMM 9724]|uniref:DUF4349 domain-containing protein n=1 Tax=Profundicola chukchiensis TaxID=2961959 RepID=UPI0024393490|nr:DUF4349 domain-containing protein [Profundicola chukchiensis]MDG4950388.1 DUF4349 domain-containing protein [Profundicola chukchiensis]
MKLALIFMLFLAVGCGGDSADGSVHSIAEPQPQLAKYSDENQEQNQTQDIASIEQMLIKTGFITFQVGDVEAKHQEILNSLKEFDAYVVTDQNYSQSNRITYSTQIRVPKQNFDGFLDEVLKGAQRIDHKTISVEDVTEEFVDVKARLKTKRELEARYLELLKKANTVSEMLEIEKQIGELQSELESYEGRIKYLQSQVQYSTLNLEYYESLSVGNQFGQEIKNGVKNGWNNLIWFFIGLINIWPFVLIISILIYLFIRYRRRRRNRKIKE